jgi:tRNA dimethylallyltransferase
MFQEKRKREDLLILLKFGRIQKMDKVFVILGPTSSGKTSLSLNLSKKYDGEIVSADSRQIYKFMDLGTGKVPVTSKKKIVKGDFVWKIDNINIWGYDLVKPDGFFSSYDYALFSLQKIRDIAKEKKNVFLTGGTGFYIDMVSERIIPSLVEPDFGLREELSGLNTNELITKLKTLDEGVLGKIDAKNPVRLIRAIEMLMKSKVNLRELPYLENAKFYYVGLIAPREFLYLRADNWAEAVWKAGLIKETESLIQMGYGASPKLKGLIYKSAVGFINKAIDESIALQRIKFDLHAYIRRQQTYFKKNPDIVWFDVSKENCKENIYNYIEGKIKNG